ncbi:MAG: PhoU domain-containing protein [Tissierellia bacterium]|nr:PhoU domain-containing protein [Tissierellia bacterium]
MRERFDIKLNDIEDRFIDLADLFLLNFDRFVLYKDDPKILDEIIDGESRIDSRIDFISNLCFNLMLREAPVAGDLRFIQTSISLASSFNHIYNHLVEAALILHEIEDKERLAGITKEFFEILKQMLANFKKALIDRDDDLAYNTVKMDDKVDSLFVRSIDFVIEEEREKLISTSELANLILYFKYFERIGDRLAKINVLLTNL